MWKWFERVMMVVGVVATAIGTGVGIYAVVSPADLTKTLTAILGRLMKEPVLEQAERVYLGTVMTIGPNVYISVAKDITNEGGTLTIQVCPEGSDDALKEETLYFSKESTAFAVQSMYRSSGNTQIVLVAQMGSTTFSRTELWRPGETTWTRAAAPQIVEGAASCSG